MKRYRNNRTRRRLNKAAREAAAVSKALHLFTAAIGQELMESHGWTGEEIAGLINAGIARARGEMSPIEDTIKDEEE